MTNMVIKAINASRFYQNYLTEKGKTLV